MRSIPRAATAALFGLALLAPATASAAPGDLDAYRVKATPQNLRALAAAGFDVREGGDRKGGDIEVVGTRAQLQATKVGARRIVDAKGRGAADRSRAASGARKGRALADDPTATADDSSYTVWTKYDAVDEPGENNEKEQYTEQYDRVLAEHPDLVAKRVTGQTYNGRDIIALQVTKGATGSDVPGRPAVLYNAMQHAREWLAGETCRRTLDYMLDNYGKTTSAGLEVTPLVDNNELWFVCVNNPDGYEYSFTPGNRLWRKNLRDNNGDGRIAPGDGVDPNRNFSANWGRDDDGSSPNPADETYRGPSAASEPETKAMEALFAEIHPVFQKNDHTAAELLLYPQGFQQDTPTADHEIFTALAGDPFKPAIEGFLPELSAGLYITNGDFTDWAYSTQKTLSYTPEGTAYDGAPSGFEYPDNEQLVAQEFRRHLPFALDLAKSAADPSEPVSHLGNKAEDLTVDAFPYSYGDPQVVQATIKRKLGPAVMRFRVNGGQTLSVPTTEFGGGERYYKNDAVYYHRVRSYVSGTKPGDSVEVWFEAGGKASAHFTYKAVTETTAPVLLLSDEDWSGVQPNPAPLAGPQYLEQYKKLLDAAGVQYDVYDIDGQGRRAPDNLGVLSHYSHVVWYTGDDYVPRAPDAPGGSGIDRLAVDTQNRVRDFLNEGGKLFYTGQNAGRAFAEGYTYNPFQVEEKEYCNTSDSCIAVQDDFLQYWLGANTYVGDGGADPDGNAYPVKGFAAPFTSGPFTLDPASHTASLLVTSSIYDPVTYPQWADSRKAMEWVRPGASPFEPFTGDWFASAGADNVAYKRLSRTVALPGGPSTFSFRASYDLERDYDYAFVEIRTAGQDDWTTLPAKNGVTSDDTGLSCISTGDGSNWQSLHPFLAHYQTKSADGSSCTSSGSSGSWNAATGNSGGWKTWELDIPAAYQGKQVELSITAATDPASLGLAFFVDDTKLVAGGAEVFSTSFEDGLGGWSAGAVPAGTLYDGPSWTRAQDAPFVEGAATTTPDTVYTGFGLEKIQGTENQVTVLREALAHLGTPKKPVAAAPVPVGASGAGTPLPVPVGTPAKPAAGKGPKVSISGKAIRASRTGRAGIRLTCPRSARTRCRTTVRLVSGRRVLGRATVTLRPGQARTVDVKLSRTARRLLTRRGRLRVQVVVEARDGAGLRGTATRRITLRPVKR